MMQMAASGSMRDPSQMIMPKSGSKKLQKMQTKEIVEMQEMMVEELKTVIDSVKEAVSAPEGQGVFKEPLLIPMVQALASCGVEKKYQITAEEMAVAGFMKAQELSVNEKFLRATMTQQQLLGTLAQVCAQGGEEAKGCSIM